MIDSFGNGDASYARTMNGLTGIGVCLLTLSTGIFGIISAGKMKAEMESRYKQRNEG